ncbi:Vsp/OspC family lipoprotein (plasmid) [Borrelia recurrentis]|uniref:Vsp protein n=1 Tax=Borrelia recurrentis (strain A1) TaxID=412418 RepID=B5RS95_BORRA|nr:Vsp/OspC family lipoprotein [Borrelia recurrentis]ACH95231.1 vsp protein [Borrelia recurrentis A1]
MGCNSGGGIKEGEEEKARKGDGSVIDLKVVGEKIKSAVEFAGKVKEVHTLVKSVDELAKAIGKKVEGAGNLSDDGGQNGSLISAAYSIISSVSTKLDALEQQAEVSTELKAKITIVKTASKKFTDTVKGASADLGKKDASDENAKKALLKSDAVGDKGAKDLVALNTAIDELLKNAEVAVASAIKELTISSNN